MCGLELAQALGVRRVRRLTVRDRKRRLPGARPQSKGRLQTRVAPFAQHRRAGEPIVGDPLPTQPRSVAGTEALDADEPRDLGREPNCRDLSAVTAELVDPERREDLVDALAEVFQECPGPVRLADGPRVLG